MVWVLPQGAAKEVAPATKATWIKTLFIVAVKCLAEDGFF